MRPVAAAFLSVLLVLSACGKTDAPPSDSLSSSGTTAPSATGHASGQAAGASPAPEETTLPPARPSELHVNRTETFYDVTGRTARALLEDLTQRGPRIGSERHFGRTSWTARWNITYEEPTASSSPPAPCRMRRTDVYVDVEVTLPRWESPSDTPEALRREWKSFSEALAFHEREHQESIISAGRRVLEALKHLEAPSCAALKEKANTKARSIIEKARQYNRRYDERTHHGRTQGARWPLD